MHIKTNKCKPQRICFESYYFIEYCIFTYRLHCWVKLQIPAYTLVCCMATPDFLRHIPSTMNAQYGQKYTDTWPSHMIKEYKQTHANIYIWKDSGQKSQNPFSVLTWTVYPLEISSLLSVSSTWSEKEGWVWRRRRRPKWKGQWIQGVHNSEVAVLWWSCIYRKKTQKKPDQETFPEMYV